MTQTTQLLVPIELKALLVNQPVINGIKFRRWQNDYSFLANNMQSPTPAPFQDTGDSPKEGFHLHWRVPQAMRHGKAGAILFVVMNHVESIVSALNSQMISSDLKAAFTAEDYGLSASGISVYQTGSGDTAGWVIRDWEQGKEFALSIKITSQGQEYIEVADAAIVFPQVANRWLICRFQHGEKKIDPVTWIVESDFMNAETGSISFLDPKEDNIGSLKVVTRIGKMEAFTTTWTEPDPKGKMFVRAIGPGDETFSAYAPAAENVFSFLDVGAAKLPENTALSYAIFGWYANPRFDPLYNPIQQIASKEFLALMKDLNWGIAGVKDLENYTGSIAKQSIYHGMVHSLEWQTETRPMGDKTQVPDDISSTVKVAIGNTSVEALSALIENTSGDQDVNITMLEALQYGVLDALDTVGGTTVVADRVRQARFGAQGAGVVWKIRARSLEQGSDIPDLTPEIAKFADALAKLNLLQRNTDENVSTLLSKQWTLYARWWKDQNYNSLGVGPTYPPADMPKIGDQLENTSKEYKQLVEEIKALQSTVSNTYSNGSLPHSTSQESIDAYASNILKLPTTLELKAMGAPRFWHPNDPVLLVSGVANPYDVTSSTALQCRKADQVVTGLTIGGTTVTTTDAASFTPLPVHNPAIPAIIYDLAKELYFLDPANWDNIAKNLFHGNATTSDIKTAIKSGSWAAPGEFGPLPFSVQSWIQPWSPIFLEWSIKWFPTYSQKTTEDPWVFDRDEWVFDGNDYNWTGTSLNNSIAMGYTGRTVLSSHSVLNFENRLKAYIEKSKMPDKKLERLETLLTTMKSWGMLSQRLSGLHSEFTTRSINPSWPPFGDVAPLIQNEFHTAPDPSKGDKDYDYGPVSPTFFPQMGGFFVIDNIEIVDSFGQCINLLAANNNPAGGPSAKSFTPIRSRQVTPKNTNISVNDYTPAQFVKQALGIVQPLRLDLRWIDASSNSEEVGYAGSANPVCGWVLPNHLDQALSIYDQTGVLLGEVRENLLTSAVEWFPAPDAKHLIPSPDAISNQHLREVVKGLLAAQKTARGSFDNFMKVIDETFWFVDPLGGRKDQNLSVLIGRPLAVLRMGVGLSLMGSPYFNQSWADTFKENDNGITKTLFQLRLGSLNLREDGVIGYFNEGQYNQFNSVHFPSGLDHESTYVKQIGGNDGNYLNVIPNAAQSSITVLMDPRGSLHGSTGILPVKEITLPSKFVDNALKHMEVTFRVGSLLTSTAAIQIPRLAEQNGTWSWINHTSPTDFLLDPIEFSSPNAKLSTPATEIRDGWLRFNTNLKGNNNE
ncbi:MAG: hypothetical protein AAFZ63_10105 [Bacteroidota bacterium]